MHRRAMLFGLFAAPLMARAAKAAAPTEYVAGISGAVELGPVAPALEGFLAPPDFVAELLRTTQLFSAPPQPFA